MALVYDTKIYSTFCKLLAGAMKFTLYDDLSDILAKADYITNALCVIVPKRKKDAKSLRHSNFMRPVRDNIFP